jgi:hypothetical protein
MASDLIIHAKRENFARPRRGHTAKAQSAIRVPQDALALTYLSKSADLWPADPAFRLHENLNATVKICKVDARLINRDSHVPRVQNNAPPRHPDNRLNHLLCTQVSTR